VWLLSSVWINTNVSLNCEFVIPEKCHTLKINVPLSDPALNWSKMLQKFPDVENSFWGTGMGTNIKFVSRLAR
jgi:hypothetical protein